MYAKDKIWLEDLADVLQHISVTNFYKYSLWDSKKKDLNPDNLKEGLKLYDRFMFENFVKHEITVLRPDYIFICGKRETNRYNLIAQWLKQQASPIKLCPIKDPAYLLHGGRVMSAPLSDKKAEKLIEIYCNYIKSKADAKDPHFYTQYGGRINQIKNYLRFYYQKMEV